MTKQEYAEYLRSPWWGRRRNEIKRARGWRCEHCLTSDNLQVHHLSYARLWAELDEDLVCLCGDCHRGEHGLTMEKIEKDLDDWLGIVRQ